MRKLLLIKLLAFFVLINPKGQSIEQIDWLTNKQAEKNALPTSFNVTSPNSAADINSRFYIQIDHPDGQTKPVLPKIGLTYEACSTINAIDIEANTTVLDGNGVTLLLIDAGRPRVDHEALGGRVCVPEQDLIVADETDPLKTFNIITGIPSLSGHTHYVAGTMIASPPAEKQEYKASANGADIISISWDFAKFDLAGYSAKGVNLVCIPWGYHAGWARIQALNSLHWYWFGNANEPKSYLFGYYGAIAQHWDDILYHAPYTLVVKSAGNDFMEGEENYSSDYYVWNDINKIYEIKNFDAPEEDGISTSSLSDIAISKNVLTVTGVDGNKSVLPFSSRGSTLDFRIKPDVASNGVIIKTINTGSSQSYTQMTLADAGTSFAASTATGGIALLLQAQEILYDKVKFLSSTTKALVIHTAQRAAAPPDVVTGYGVIDIGAAVNVMEDNASNDLAHQSQHIHEITLTEGSIYRLLVRKTLATELLKATICWTDPAPATIDAPQLPTGPATPSLVNDIDLRIYKTSSSSPFTKDICYYPFYYNGQTVATGDNTADNVEQIIVNDANTDYYLVEVSAKPGKLTGVQQVSLVITGNAAITGLSDITVPTGSINDTRIYKADSSITFNGSTITIVGSDVTSLAPSINLKTGFRATLSAHFRASSPQALQSTFEYLYPAREFSYSSIVCQNEYINDPIIKQSELASDSIKNDLFNSVVNIYPNPVQSTLFINSPDDDELTRVQIVDVMGREVYLSETTIGCCHEVDVENFRSGIYQVRVQTNKSEYKQLIVKK